MPEGHCCIRERYWLLLAHLVRSPRLPTVHVASCAPVASFSSVLLPVFAARLGAIVTYNVLLRDLNIHPESQKCRLVVLVLEVGRWSPEASQFVRLFARCRARAVPRPLRHAAIAAFTSPCSPSLPPEALVPVSLVFPSLAQQMSMATNLCSARSFPRLASTKLRLLPSRFPPHE